MTTKAPRTWRHKGKVKGQLGLARYRFLQISKIEMPTFLVLGNFLMNKEHAGFRNLLTWMTPQTFIPAVDPARAWRASMARQYPQTIREYRRPRTAPRHFPVPLPRVQRFEVDAHADLEPALNAALRDLGKNDLLCIAGSTYLAGRARTLLSDRVANAATIA